MKVLHYMAFTDRESVIKELVLTDKEARTPELWMRKLEEALGVELEIVAHGTLPEKVQ